MNRLLGLGLFALLLVSLTALAQDKAADAKVKPKDDKATFESVVKAVQARPAKAGAAVAVIAVDVALL